MGRVELEEINSEDSKPRRSSWGGSQKMSTINEVSLARGLNSDFHLSTQGSAFSGSQTPGRAQSDFENGQGKDMWKHKRGTRSAQRKEHGQTKHRKNLSQGNARNIDTSPNPDRHIPVQQSGGKTQFC